MTPVSGCGDQTLQKKKKGGKWRGGIGTFQRLNKEYGNTTVKNELCNKLYSGEE